MLERIDHIAVAVEDLDQSIETYEKLGLRVTHREVVEDFGVEIATIDAGNTAIELIAPRDADSPIRKFIDERGPGLHHVAFVVDDIEKALDQVRRLGYQLIDETPRRGKENSLVAFIHPGSTGKVLYELVQLAKT